MKISRLFGVRGADMIKAARMADVLFVTGAVYFVIKASGKLFPKEKYSGEVRWLFVALAGFMPQAIFLGTYVNTDSLALLAAAIILYTMIKNALISAIAAVIGEVILVVIYVVKSSVFEGGIQKVLNIFNLSGHFDNFTSNIFDIKGIVYFLSVIAVCLFLTMQSISKRRWN